MRRQGANLLYKAAGLLERRFAAEPGTKLNIRDMIRTRHSKSL